MKRDRSYILYCWIFIIILYIIPSSAYSQGISFIGNDGLMENRTSYSVFEKKKYLFNNSFTISFDLQIKQLEGFGYIFRLKDGDENIYNLTYTYNNKETCSLKFNVEGENNLLTINLPTELFSSGKWQQVTISFLLNENTLLVKINGKEYKAKGLKTDKKISPSIYFGKSEHIVDLPAFSLRNLQVGNNEQILSFPFNESSGSDVHDQNQKITGKVDNPIWLINDAYFWKHIFTYKSKAVSSICFDASKPELIMFNRDSILYLSLTSNKYKTEKYNNPLPVNIQLGTSFVDTIRGRIYAYEVNNLPIGDTTIAYLDSETRIWHTVSTQYLPMQLHHHVEHIDYDHNRFFIFGGFGNQRYNKNIYTLNLLSGLWSTTPYKGDSIPPRYFSGLAEHNKKLYIYGGMGNESGDQTIGKRYFYDLFQLDMNSMTSVKLWDIQWDRHNMVPVRNMIMLNDSSFYTLCYPEHISNTYLQLYRFSVKDGKYSIFGDSIPILSEKITTNANLYYSGSLNKFYCTVQIFQDDGSSITEVYSLDNPPIDAAGLTIYSTQQYNYWIWLIITVCSLCLVGWFIHYIKKKKEEAKDVVLPAKTDLISTPKLRGGTINRIKDRANAIYLFGEFTVYNRKGQNITYMFSSRLEQALLLIMEWSGEEGISTQRLSEELWPDRAEYSVKNIRNVTINHLRKCISELSGLELMYDKGYYRLTLTDDCYCDYLHYRKLISDGRHTYDTPELKNILSRGCFLKSNIAPSTSEFQKRERERIKSILPIDIDTMYQKANYEETIILCDLLFLNDELSETALSYKINALSNLEHTEEAKRIYALYSIKYLQLTNQKYTKPFSEVIFN